MLLQQTPFEVIEAPPSLVMLPPLDAVEVVIDEIELVLIVGNEIDKVLKLIILP